MHDNWALAERDCAGNLMTIGIPRLGLESRHHSLAITVQSIGSALPSATVMCQLLRSRWVDILLQGSMHCNGDPWSLFQLGRSALEYVTGILGMLGSQIARCLTQST